MMSALGLHEPNMVPASDLVHQDEVLQIDFDRPSQLRGHAGEHARPALAGEMHASRTSSAVIRDGETTTASAMTPYVRSRTSSSASAAVAALWVAPNCNADFCLNSTGSTATIARRR